MTEKEITQIRIGRRDYNIASDEWQPLYTKRLGDILDNEIKALEKETGLVDNYKLLILASLKILDRLLQIEEKKTGTNQFVEEEIERLNSQIENII